MRDCRTSRPDHHLLRPFGDLRNARLVHAAPGSLLERVRADLPLGHDADLRSASAICQSLPSSPMVAPFAAGALLFEPFFGTAYPLPNHAPDLRSDSIISQPAPPGNRHFG